MLPVPKKKLICYECRKAIVNFNFVDILFLKNETSYIPKNNRVWFHTDCFIAVAGEDLVPKKSTTKCFCCAKKIKDEYHFRIWHSYRFSPYKFKYSYFHRDCFTSIAGEEFVEAFRRIR